MSDGPAAEQVAMDEFEEVLVRRLRPAKEQQRRAVGRYRLAGSELAAANAKVAALEAAQRAYREQMGGLPPVAGVVWSPPVESGETRCIVSAPYLIVGYPTCSGCFREVSHDGDSYYCDRCDARWDETARSDGDTATMTVEGGAWKPPVPAETQGGAR